MAFLAEQRREIGPEGGRAVDDEDAGAAEARLAARLVRRHGGALAQERPDAQQQQVAVGGFRHVGVGAALQALALDVPPARLGQHQDRRRPGAHGEPHLPRQLVAVHPGQVVIGHHEVGQAVIHRLQRGFRGGVARHRKAVALQEEAQLQGLGLGILDQQDAGRGSGQARHAGKPGCTARRTRGAIRSRGSTLPAALSRTAAAGIP